VLCVFLWGQFVGGGVVSRRLFIAAAASAVVSSCVGWGRLCCASVSVAAIQTERQRVQVCSSCAQFARSCSCVGLCFCGSICVVPSGLCVIQCGVPSGCVCCSQCVSLFRSGCVMVSCCHSWVSRHVARPSVVSVVRVVGVVGFIGCLVCVVSSVG